MHDRIQVARTLRSLRKLTITCGSHGSRPLPQVWRQWAGKPLHHCVDDRGAVRHGNVAITGQGVLLMRMPDRSLARCEWRDGKVCIQ